MIYYIDTEFIEHFKKPLPWLPTVGDYNKPAHRIDLISIGIVCSDGREYYAISKDFDLKDAWNKYDLKPDINNGGFKKEYWLRENVLKNILNTNKYKYYKEVNTFSEFKNLINHFGKSNRQIAHEVVEFCNCSVVYSADKFDRMSASSNDKFYSGTETEFYGYYSDYDWVSFCSLFGKMIDLPKGFPMYCKDLKQMLDEKCDERKKEWLNNSSSDNDFDMLNHIKTLPYYPKQQNEHNALNHAKWTKKLHEFLIEL